MNGEPKVQIELRRSVEILQCLRMK